MKRREKVRTKTFTFTAVFEPDKEMGGFVVTFPAIPNLATQGETLEHAREMAAECLEIYLEYRREYNLPIPAFALRPFDGLRTQRERNLSRSS